MPRRRPVLPMPARLARRLTPTDTTGTVLVIESADMVRGRALDVLSTMPSRYITTKSVLDTYLDSIGVGR
jgi:hypothetical protein